MTLHIQFCGKQNHWLTVQGGGSCDVKQFKELEHKMIHGVKCLFHVKDNLNAQTSPVQWCHDDEFDKACVHDGSAEKQRACNP